MEENKWELNRVVGTIFSRLVDERIKRETLSELLIEKEIITKEELDNLYQIKFKEKSEEYSAETLGMTVEEYRNLIK